MTSSKKKSRRRSAKPRHVASARANGAKGGRPRSRLPAEILDKLGPPPSDEPLQLARWVTRLQAEVFWLQLQGKVAADLAASVRAFAGSIARAQPTDIAAALERLLKADAKETAADERGPQPEKVANAG